MANLNGDSSTSKYQKDVDTNVVQEHKNIAKPMNGRSSKSHDIRNKEDKSDSSEEENESESSEEEPNDDSFSDTERRLESLYTEAGFSASEYNDVDDWIYHDSDDSDDSAFLNNFEATYFKNNEDIHDRLSKDQLSASQAQHLLQVNHENLTRFKCQREERTRRNEFDARLAKFLYLRAVQFCEKGHYEMAAENVEEASEKRPKNEMVKELKRKITILRIGELEKEIKELRKSWWKSREE